MSVVLLAQMWRFMSKKGIWYVKGGIGKIPELLAERLRAFGGEIRMGEKVERIMILEGAVSGRELADLSALRGHHLLVKLKEGVPVP